MGRRRVEDRRLQRVLEHVLQRAGGVGTLTHLAELVNEELAREDPRFRVSPPRLRRVAATTPGIHLKIHTRRGRSQQLKESCPVCGNPLARVENATLTGSRVVLEARCAACPYWTGRARRVPVRYTFQVEGAKSGSGS